MESLVRTQVQGLGEAALKEHNKIQGSKEPTAGPRRQSIMSGSSNAGEGKLAAMLGRRRSTMKSLAKSLIMMRRFSTKTKTSEVPSGPPKVQLENTYKLNPDDDKKFSPRKVEEVVQRVFQTYLDDEKYNHIMGSTLARELSNIIKDRVKDMELPRYKIVCNVMIGQKKDQGIQTASRSVWDETHDNHACVYYQNETLFAVAMIHGIYFE